MKKKVIVLGASGMLGHKVCQVLARRGHDVTGMFRRPVQSYVLPEAVFSGVRLVGGVDVLAEQELDRGLARERPDWVVNCVGLVKQLQAASDPCLAIAINSLLPHRLARRCAEIGSRLVHISTDCVFSGRSGGYREDDPADASDLYGRSKALGETLQGEAAAVTLRTSFIGRELSQPRHGLVEWFLSQEGRAVQGFDAVIYSGLTSLELASVIVGVVERSESLHGVFHVAGEPISKYSLLCLVRDIYGLDVEIERSEEPRSDRSLVMEAFTDATGYRAPSWPELIRMMYEDATPYGV